MPATYTNTIENAEQIKSLLEAPQVSALRSLLYNKNYNKIIPILDVQDEKILNPHISQGREIIALPVRNAG